MQVGLKIVQLKLLDRVLHLLKQRTFESKFKFLCLTLKIFLLNSF